MTTLNKPLESKKGYWTDDENRGLSLNVTQLLNDDTRISLSSDHWYRVQHFDLSETSTTEAWRIIKATMKECGRTLIVHPSEDQESSVHYQVASLSAKQVDQIYYLLKHGLTTANVVFTITHSFMFDTSDGVAAPPKRRRRKKKTFSEEEGWQTAVKR